VLFRSEEKIYYREHSIIYVTRKRKVGPVQKPDRYKQYKKLYADFFYYYLNFVERLNIQLSKTDRGVYLFGACSFSQYFICLGLDMSKIKGVLDNSQLKNGKRLYGTSLLIKTPIGLNGNSLIILKVGAYIEEIKKQLLDINPSIEILN